MSTCVVTHTKNSYEEKHEKSIVTVRHPNKKKEKEKEEGVLFVDTSTLDMLEVFLRAN